MQTAQFNELIRSGVFVQVVGRLQSPPLGRSIPKGGRKEKPADLDFAPVRDTGRGKAQIRLLRYLGGKIF